VPSIHFDNGALHGRTPTLQLAGGISKYHPTRAAAKHPNGLFIQR
jgi:hypothetical protein